MHKEMANLYSMLSLDLRSVTVSIKDFTIKRIIHTANVLEM